MILPHLHSYTHTHTHTQPQLGLIMDAYFEASTARVRPVARVQMSVLSPEEIVSALCCVCVCGWVYEADDDGDDGGGGWCIWRLRGEGEASL
jgi:hypothetical protein